VLPRDLDDRCDASVGDAEGLLPGMKEETPQPERLERPFEFRASIVAEQRVDPRDSG